MRKYKVVETDEIFEEIDDVIDNCIDEQWHEDDDYFEEWVNDMYSGVEICGTYYYPYDIVRNADDGNLDDLLNDFCESQNESDADEARWQLQHNEIGSIVDIQRYEVEIIDDEAGDTDGDKEVDLEAIRMSLTSYDDATAEEKKNEEDMMSLFQHIGG